MTTAAFGMIIATGDYECDLDAIVDVLNSLKLTHNDDDPQWIAYGNGTIGLPGCNHEYPTAYPSRDILEQIPINPSHSQRGRRSLGIRRL